MLPNAAVIVNYDFLPNLLFIISPVHFTKKFLKIQDATNKAWCQVVNDFKLKNHNKQVGKHVP
jgi:hypothetical protein